MQLLEAFAPRIAVTYLSVQTQLAQHNTIPLTPKSSPLAAPRPIEMLMTCRAAMIIYEPLSLLPFTCLRMPPRLA